MSRFPLMFAFALTCILIASGLGLSLTSSGPAVSAPPRLDCACPVLHAVANTFAQGSCNMPGQGSVPCISFLDPPQILGGSLPRDGICQKGSTCTPPPQPCYIPGFDIQMSLAGCSSTCCSAYKVYLDGAQVGGDWSSGSFDPDPDTAGFLHVAPVGISGTPCLTPTQTRTVEVKCGGTTKFILTVHFGCGDCGEQPE